jgi:hypothetical protein
MSEVILPASSSPNTKPNEPHARANTKVSESSLRQIKDLSSLSAGADAALSIDPHGEHHAAKAGVGNEQMPHAVKRKDFEPIEQEAHDAGNESQGRSGGTRAVAK